MVKPMVGAGADRFHRVTVLVVRVQANEAPIGLAKAFSMFE
jgi:hypothetical protein